LNLETSLVGKVATGFPEIRIVFPEEIFGRKGREVLRIAWTEFTFEIASKTRLTRI